jgi:cytochrome c oxidase subunit 2
MGLVILVGTTFLSSTGALARVPPAAVRVIEVTASRYQFDPSVIEVEEGQRVVLELHSTDGAHGIVIKGVKAKASIPEDGSSVTLEFVAKKAGTFAFACNEYCGPGHLRMKGRLVVKPKQADEGSRVSEGVSKGGFHAQGRFQPPGVHGRVGDGALGRSDVDGQWMRR